MKCLFFIGNWKSGKKLHFHTLTLLVCLRTYYWHYNFEKYHGNGLLGSTETKKRSIDAIRTVFSKAQTTFKTFAVDNFFENGEENKKKLS